MEQTVKFPVLAVASIEDKERQKVFFDLLNKLSLAKEDEAREAILKEAKNEITEAEKESLQKSFNVSSYLDSVDVHLKLESFLFEAYASQQKEPEAPFAKFSFQKRLQDLLNSLKKEDLSADDLDDEFCNTVQHVLSDDEAWKSLQVYASIERKDAQDLFFPLNHNGLAYFDKIINKTVEILHAKSNQKEQGETEV